MINFVRRNLKIVIPVGIVGIAAVAWLAIGFFGIHTLFFDNEVSEDGPVFASGATAAEPAEAADEAPAEEPAEEAAVAEEPAEEAEEAPAEEEAAAPGEVVTLVSGDFIDRGHPTSGQAVVLNDGTEQRFLRFEDFQTDNGPDLNVYLVSSDANADNSTFGADFIDLGDLKGNIGEQNYEIPPDVDLEVYDTVVIWCVRFSTSFGAADLA